MIAGDLGCSTRYILWSDSKRRYASIQENVVTPYLWWQYSSKIGIYLSLMLLSIYIFLSHYWNLCNPRGEIYHLKISETCNPFFDALSSPNYKLPTKQVGLPMPFPSICATRSVINANLIGYYFWGASGIECGVRSLKWCIRRLVLLPAERGGSAYASCALLTGPELEWN